MIFCGPFAVAKTNGFPDMVMCGDKYKIQLLIYSAYLKKIVV